MALIGDKAVDIVDIKEYVGIVLKRKWLVMACFIVCLGATTVFLRLQPPVYMSTGTIQTKAGIEVVPVENVIRPGDWTKDAVLNSLPILNGEAMIDAAMKRALPKVGLPPNVTPAEARSRYLKKAVATGNRLTSFITLTVETIGNIGPRLAREFTNAWIEEFLEYKERERNEAIRKATANIQDLLHLTDARIKEAQQQIEKFRDQHNLGQLDQRMNMDSERLLQLNSQRDSIRNERIKLEVQKPIIEKDPIYNFMLVIRALDPAAAAQAGQNPEAATIGADNRVTRSVSPFTSSLYFDLQKKRQLALMRMEAARTIYLDKHPVVQQLQGEIALLDAQIAQEVQFGVERYNMQIAVLLAQEKRLTEEIEIVEKSAQESARKLQQYDNLRDNLDGLKRQREQQQKLLDKAIADEIVRVDSFRMQEPAQLGVQVGPKYRTGLLLSAFFGLGLGIALAFFIEYVDDSIKVAEEVERDLKLPFLGVVPSAHWSAEDLKTHLLHNLSQQSGISEAYRMVRSAVLFAAPKDKLKVLQLTSAVPLEGKTTTTLNLGIGFAQAGEKVLLIDCDLRRGELHRYFDLPKENGLTDVLRAEKTPDEVLKHTEVENLDLVSTGIFPPNPAEMLLSPKMKELIDWARERYDRVFIDCPPAMGISDTAILSSLVDGLILVVWAGHTSRRLVRAAKDGLLARGANLIGFLLNNLDVGRVGYYYYYPYYYSYYYTYKSDETAKDKEPKKPTEQPEDLY